MRAGTTRDDKPARIFRVQSRCTWRGAAALGSSISTARLTRGRLAGGLMGLPGERNKPRVGVSTTGVAVESRSPYPRESRWTPFHRVKLSPDSTLDKETMRHLFCRIFHGHRSLTRPIHGHYICMLCLCEFPVRWSETTGAKS